MIANTAIKMATIATLITVLSVVLYKMNELINKKWLMKVDYDQYVDHVQLLFS